MITDITPLLGKIHNIDCLTFMREFPEGCIDLTVTSPPYDNLRDYKGYVFDFEGIAKELFRITKQGGVLVWVVGDATINGSETGTSFRQALFFKDCGFNLHDTMIYSKSGFAFPSINKYHQVFEYMFIFSKGKPSTFNPIKDRRNLCIKRGGDCKRQKDGSMKKGDNGGGWLEEKGQRFNIWNFNTGGGVGAKDKEAYLHPATFPELLANDHIISWSNPGDIVYDCFMGSGTVGKMSERNNRKWLGTEISKEYCEIANKRIEAEINQLKLF